MIWRSADIRVFTPKEYDQALAMLDGQKKQRVEKIRQRKDKMRTVFADLLARQLLSEALKTAPEDICFTYSAEGKPLLANGPLHFSISHSENIVVACVCDVPIGIDVEGLREVDPRIALRFFTPAELIYVFGHEPKDVDFEKALPPDVRLRFFEIWTAKEAYLKCSGEGMSRAKTIDTTRLSFERHLLPDDYLVTIFR